MKNIEYCDRPERKPDWEIVQNDVAYLYALSRLAMNIIVSPAQEAGASVCAATPEAQASTWILSRCEVDGDFAFPSLLIRWAIAYWNPTIPTSDMWLLKTRFLGWDSELQVWVEPDRIVVAISNRYQCVCAPRPQAQAFTPIVAQIKYRAWCATGQWIGAFTPHHTNMYHVQRLTFWRSALTVTDRDPDKPRLVRYRLGAGGGRFTFKGAVPFYVGKILAAAQLDCDTFVAPDKDSHAIVFGGNDPIEIVIPTLKQRGNTPFYHYKFPEVLVVEEMRRYEARSAGTPNIENYQASEKYAFFEEFEYLEAAVQTGLGYESTLYEHLLADYEEMVGGRELLVETYNAKVTPKNIPDILLSEMREAYQDIYQHLNDFAVEVHDFSKWYW